MGRFRARFLNYLRTGYGSTSRKLSTSALFKPGSWLRSAADAALYPPMNLSRIQLALEHYIHAYSTGQDKRTIHIPGIRSAPAFAAWQVSLHRRPRLSVAPHYILHEADYPTFPFYKLLFAAD